MHKSKLLALLLAVAMVVSMVVVPVYAAGGEIAFSLTADKTTVEPGGTVVVTMKLDSNPGFQTLNTEVDYDSTAGWELTGLATPYTSNLTYTQGSIMAQGSPSYASDPYCVILIAAPGLGSNSVKIEGTGSLVEFTFTAPETAGEYDFTLNVKEAFDENNNAMAVSGTLNCTVTVAAEGGSASSECPVHGQVDWTEVAEGAWNAGGALTSGHYKLNGDVALTAALTVADTETVCIDLNGCDITAPGTSGVRAIENYGVLTILDSAETDGVISGGKYAPSANSSEETYIYGGNILVSGASAKLNLHGGTVSGGSMDPKNYQQKTLGANIAVIEGATFNMYGGMVKDGYIKYDQVWSGNCNGGGNIYAKGSTVNIYGGTITGGEVNGDYASSTTSARTALAVGGNIYVEASSTLNIEGGLITGGYAHAHVNAKATTSTATHLSYVFGGNICSEESTLKISGGVIENGHIKATSEAASGSREIKSWGGNIAVLSGTAQITGGALSGGYTESDADASYCGGGNLFLTSVKEARGKGNSTSADVTVKNVTMTAYDGAAGYRGAHIYSHYSKLTLEGSLLLTGGKVNQWGGQVYAQGGSLTIFDGVVIESGTATKGNALATNSGCDLKLYGGKIGQLFTRNPEATIYGGSVEDISQMTGDGYYIYVYNGTLNKNPNELENCSVKCSKAHINGGNVWHNVGACSDCGHTYVEAFTAETPNSDTTHKTVLGAHTYVEGICSACGAEEPQAVTQEKACKHCNNEVKTWTAWDGIGAFEDGGHYFLAENVKMPVVQAEVSGISVCLDLNGCTLTAPDGVRAFKIGSGGSLRILDNSAENTGAVKGSDVAVDANGGLVYMTGSASSFYLYDATLKDGWVYTYNYGGGIYANDGSTLVIDNGKVLNCKISGEGTNGANARGRGGNISMYDSGTTLYIKGQDAVISGGKIETESNVCYGGNLYMGSGPIAYIQGGTISGGVTSDGWSADIMNMKGTIYMSGGTVGNAESHANSFVLYDDTSNQGDLYATGGTIYCLKDSGSANLNVIQIGEGVTTYFDPSEFLYNCVALNDSSAGNYVTYADFGDAFAASVLGDTIILGKEAEVDALELSGQTVDLNGNKLKVADLRAEIGHVIDSKGTGTLDAAEVKFNGSNAMLPVKTGDSYVFETPVIKEGYTVAPVEGEDTAKYAFYIENTAEAVPEMVAALKAGTLELVIEVDWDQNPDSQAHRFVLDGDMVELYADNWDTKMIVLNLVGLTDVTGLTCNAVIESCGVTKG